MRDFYDGVMNEVSRILRHYIDDLLPSKGYNQTVNSKIRDACLRLNSALNVKFDYNYKYPHDVGVLESKSDCVPPLGRRYVFCCREVRL